MCNSKCIYCIPLFFILFFIAVILEELLVLENPPKGISHLFISYLVPVH